jgi:hypothetical protein
MDDSGDGGPKAIDVVLGEADLDAGFGSADLLGGAAGKDAMPQTVMKVRRRL